KQPLLLVIPEGREEETITRLSRVGFDNVLGYLDGGIKSWQDDGFETDSIQSISPETFAEAWKAGNAVVVDARKPGEFEAEHIKDAISLPLDNVHSNFTQMPEETFYVHCAGGYRSVIMASILKARGIHNMINVEKGMSGIRNTDVAL